MAGFLALAPQPPARTGKVHGVTAVLGFQQRGAVGPRHHQHAPIVGVLRHHRHQVGRTELDLFDPTAGAGRGSGHCSLIGIPCACMYCLAWRSVNSPK